MLSLIFGLMTTAAADGPRGEPLILSMATGEVLVRVHDRGGVRLMVCPVPDGVAPDLTFAQPHALKFCGTASREMPDGAATLHAFGDEFERLVREHAEPPVSRRRAVGRAALRSLAYATFAAVGPTAIGVTMLRGDGPDAVRFALKLGLGVSGIVGGMTFLDETRRQTTAELERRELTRLPLSALREDVAAPTVILGSPETFNAVTRLAARAVANVATGAAPAPGPGHIL